MSCDPNDYTSAALILQGIVDDHRAAGDCVTSGEQWIARIQDRGRQVAGELMRQRAIADQIEHLLRDNNLHEDPDCEGAMTQAVADLMQQFEVTPREDQCPF